MSTPKKLAKMAQKLIQQILQMSRTITKKLMNWLLRGLFVLGRSSRPSQVGFVLPTVVMVILVVTLLVTAIMVRSFDRSKNISNYRVSQEVMNAALPALDRARAKIEALLEDPKLPRGTPSDISITQVLTEAKYNFNDEVPLKLAYDFGNGTGGAANNTIETLSSGANSIKNEEQVSTAWRFPVDTDNNGLYDSFTLYSILFRTPPVAAGQYDRKRTPLESRSQPMDEGGVSAACAAAVGTSASLVGTEGWYTVRNQLKKSFFIYVATVPITDKANASITADSSKYENYRGNQGFSALEYQRDQAKIPLTNNAVLYEDDLDIRSGTAFTLNGRVFTNSNLFVTELSNNLTFRLVSSKNSCFFEADNSKIVVGGNLGYGYVPATTTPDNNPITVDLFKGTGTTPGSTTLGTGSTSLTEVPAQMAYNTLAYEERIKHLVNKAVTLSPDPATVTEKAAKLLANNAAANPTEARQKALDAYFRARTRRVPFKEVPYGTDETLTSADDPVGSGETLRPPDKWIYPFDPTDGKSGGSYSKVTLRESSGKLVPSATEFAIQEASSKEDLLGDRILIGNNLPAQWLKDGQFVGGDAEQPITGVTWDAPTGTSTTRSRKTRAQVLSDLGDINRYGFWEVKSLEKPSNPIDGVGGLRVVTGAGIYLPDDDVITATVASNVVWPDTMPVITTSPTELAPSTKKRPFLKMRATAVYHYRNSNPKAPIACVSSYYDPTSPETAVNRIDPSGGTPPATAKSVNGITYGPPTATEASVLSYLNYQANLVYPNGRPVNKLLKDALAVTTITDRTLAQQAAVDSTICGLQIYGKTLPTPNTTTWGDIGNPNEIPTTGYTLPHGTIKEITFLDSRQIKSIENSYDPSVTTASTPAVPASTLTDNKSDLAIEQRQPMEIRATVLDLDQLRKSRADTGSSGQPKEYMLPYSGIIYATRDDALADASDDTTNLNASASTPSIAATDFKLDPTRRPNGIMLIHGTRLWRADSPTQTEPNTFREEEKGLILASNLPVYIKADPQVAGSLGGFNPHQDKDGNLQLEFTDTGSSFYNRSSANTNFACRKGDPRLPSTSCQTPDEWRPATILADAVTLLSSSFREGYRNEGDYDLRNNQTDNVANPEVYPTTTSTPKILLDGKEIQQNRLKLGFWDNNFVTNGLSSSGITVDGKTPTEADYSSNSASTSIPTNYVGSSYFNNFVTPIQRRTTFREYVMEICRKIPVEDCQPNDWVVGYDFNGDGLLTGAEADVRASDLVARTSAPNPPARPNTAAANARSVRNRLGAGTTATATLVPEDRRFARRVAFLRYPLSDPTNPNKLVLSGAAPNATPIVLGLNGSDQVQYYSYADVNIPVDPTTNKFSPAGSAVQAATNGAPRTRGYALWYKTTSTPDAPTAGDSYNSNNRLFLLQPLTVEVAGVTTTPGVGTIEQPLLVPVLQLHSTTGLPDNTLKYGNVVRSTWWLQRVTSGDTYFNLVMATGDSPSRPPVGTDEEGDFNGGLPNLPRFLEHWAKGSTGTRYDTKISGSFIQIKRSSYASAPFWQIPKGMTASNSTYPDVIPAGGLFGYPQGYNLSNNNGKTPSYEAPERTWGFDVGLLSQLPDLFSQQFTLPATEKPTEFFREVSRDDEWVQTLLCAKTRTSGTNAINSDQRPTAFCTSKTGG